MAYEDYLEKAVHGTKEFPFIYMDFNIEKDTKYYTDHFFVDRHWHPEIEILYIEKGCYDFEYNLESKTLHKGDICFINSQQLHQIRGTGKATHHHAFLFQPDILSFSYMDAAQNQIILPLLTGHLRFPFVLSPEQSGYNEILIHIRHIISLCQQDLIPHTMAAVPQTSLHYLRIKTILLEILSLLLKHKQMLTGDAQPLRIRKKAEQLKQVFTYMEQHYPEKITLEQLAADLGFNKEYFCRFFKQTTGISPFEYLLRLRINKSCEALLQTDRKILEISLDCGFGSEGYFIHTFKKIKGETPGAFRKAARSSGA